MFSRKFNNIRDHGLSTCEYEISILEVGESFDYPILCFSAFELVPLVGVEETIIVGKMGVLAYESNDLSFDSEGIVTNNDGSGGRWMLHSYEKRNIFIISDSYLTSKGSFLMLL